MTSIAAAKSATRDQMIGMICLAVGVSIFGLQDALFKLMSGDYAVHQLLFVRSLVAVPIVFLFAARQAGGFPRLRMPWLHVLRGLLMYIAYILYYLAIARISVAENAAVFSVTPLLITVLGALVLHERVGRRTWIALAVSGFGVLLILHPTSTDFDPALIFPLLAAVAYAFGVVCTRRLGLIERSGTLSLSVMLAYALASGITGLALAGIEPAEDTFFKFLMNPWRMPERGDFGLMIGCGVISAVGYILICQAYRLAEVNRAAPFEYSAMPTAVLWGYLFFQFVPSFQTLLGAVIVVLGGLYALRADRGFSAVRQDEEGRA